MTSASISRRWARSVSRSSAPGPAPTSATWPLTAAGAASRARRCALGLAAASGRQRRAPARPRRSRARSGVGRCPWHTCRSAAPRNECASVGQRAERRRQQPVDLGADQLGEHRAGALAADRHADRCAIDDRRREEIAELGPVDGVDGNAGAARVTSDPGVETGIAACRKRQHRAGQVFGTVRLGDVSSLAGGEPGGELDLWLLCDDDQRGASLAEQLGLGKRFAPLPTTTTVAPSTRTKTGKALSLAACCGKSELRILNRLSSGPGLSAEGMVWQAALPVEITFPGKPDSQQ